MNDADRDPAPTPRRLPPVFFEVAALPSRELIDSMSWLSRLPNELAAVATAPLLQTVTQTAQIARGWEPPWRSLLTPRSGVADYMDWVRKSTAQITQISEWLLPANIRPLNGTDWVELLNVSQQDGVCLVWAPRYSIVRELLDADGTEARDAILAERREDILADIKTSLLTVENPDLLERAQLAIRAAAAAEAGHWEASLALATTVVDVLVEKYLKPDLRQEFPGLITSGGTPGAHTVLTTAFTQVPPALRAHSYVRWLVLAGLQHAFHFDTDRYNRHAVVHADSTGYSESFVLPALLIMQAVMRDLETRLPYPED